MVQEELQSQKASKAQCSDEPDLGVEDVTKSKVQEGIFGHPSTYHRGDEPGWPQAHPPTKLHARAGWSLFPCCFGSNTERSCRAFGLPALVGLFGKAQQWRGPLPCCCAGREMLQVLLPEEGAASQARLGVTLVMLA